MKSQFNKCDKGIKCLTPLSTIFQLHCGSKCDDYSVIEWSAILNCLYDICLFVALKGLKIMMFNATFDNASVISWHSSLVNVMISLSLSKVKNWAVCRGPSWSWSYGSWIYTYLCNQSISPLTLWVRTSLKARCTRYNIML